MKSLIGLHVHSKYSGDGDAEPEEYVLRAIERRLSGIAFTEHYSFGASEPVEQLRDTYGDGIMIFRGGRTRDGGGTLSCIRGRYGRGRTRQERSWDGRYRKGSERNLGT